MYYLIFEWKKTYSRKPNVESRDQMFDLNNPSILCAKCSLSKSI